MFHRCLRGAPLAYRFPAVYDGFDPGSAILPGITEGWPRVLSDLKTVLETGDTLVPA